MDSRRFYGVYRGSVFDNRDPINSNRLKILVPQILGSAPTEWAWGTDPASMSVEAPAIGQGVLVMFEGGDPVYPIWIGTFGKAADDNKQVYVSPLSSSVPTSGLYSTLKTRTSGNGDVELDLTATLMAMANVLPFVSPTAPSNPVQGSMWYNSTTAKRYLYYGTAWIQI